MIVCLLLLLIFTRYNPGTRRVPPHQLAMDPGVSFYLLEEQRATTGIQGLECGV
jgi:hypothetical protein